MSTSDPWVYLSNDTSDEWVFITDNISHGESVYLTTSLSKADKCYYPTTSRTQASRYIYISGRESDPY